MSGSRPGSYGAEVDFRISQSPPQLVTDDAAAIYELYAFAQQVIRTLIDDCGISSPLPSMWPQLSGSPRLLLSGNLNRLYVTASETISPFAAVSLHNVAGNLRVRNANAANNTRPCDGFLTKITSVGIGEIGEVTLHSGVSVFAGLVVGSRYYLSTTNGLVSTIPAGAVGNIEQFLGVAVTVNHLAFTVGHWIQH